MKLFVHRYDAIVVSIIIMTINKKYIEAILPSLSPYKAKQFRDGSGYQFPCPFCSSHQKRESKVNEKCAALSPLAGSYQWVFNCQRGIRGGRNERCNRPMRLIPSLDSGIHPLQEVQEGEQMPAQYNKRKSRFLNDQPSLKHCITPSNRKSPLSSSIVDDSYA